VANSCAWVAGERIDQQRNRGGAPLGAKTDRTALRALSQLTRQTTGRTAKVFDRVHRIAPEQIRPSWLAVYYTPLSDRIFRPGSAEHSWVGRDEPDFLSLTAFQYP
jgi:hypothetical protein